jgi:hypothetical protein
VSGVSAVRIVPAGPLPGLTSGRPPHLFHHAAQGLGDRLITMPPTRGYRRRILRWQPFALTVIIVP